MSIPLSDLPALAARASVRLRDEVLAVVGEDLVAVWVHGGTTFPDRPRRTGDLDVCAVIAKVGPDERHPAIWRADPTSRPARVFAAHDALASELGVSLDVTYLLESEVHTGVAPPGAFWEEHRITDWPVSRAHWLAGQYVHLYGKRPEDLVLPPTRAELERALDRELEHLERHVYEGDADDPYEATYAVWNGCRILYTLETGSPVISKRSAGDWALQHLPDQWHGAIRAAGRNYDGEATAHDVELLRTNMAPFVEMVRERLPVSEPRPPGPPRWS
jgi:streptomycin 3"-adenylyltransferase